MMSPDIRFTALGAPRRIWALSAIHGDLERLYALHDAILERLRPGDRIVYLGNYTGYSIRSRETIDEILTFRRLALSMPGMRPADIIYLRGRQEDMGQRLLQLQFTNKPEQTLQVMLENGVEETLQSYGIRSCDGMQACKEGVLSLTRWTNKIRDAMKKNAGHEVLSTHYRRAAYTGMADRFPLLFVNAGVDPTLPLENQGDSFYWSGDDFCEMTQAYAPFEKVIRGYDPRHEGVRINCVTASLDGGCGFGGSLICAGMDAEGRVHELLQA